MRGIYKLEYLGGKKGRKIFNMQKEWFVQPRGQC